MRRLGGAGQARGRWRPRLLVIALALGTLGWPAITQASSPWVSRASGTFTYATVYQVTFSERLATDGSVSGAIDFAYPATYLNYDLIGTARCGGTVDATTGWIIYDITNAGTPENNGFVWAAVLYHDGGRGGANDGVRLHWSALPLDPVTGCATEGAFLAGLTPNPIDAGNITVR